MITWKTVRTILTVILILLIFLPLFFEPFPATPWLDQYPGDASDRREGSLDDIASSRNQSGEGNTSSSSSSSGSDAVPGHVNVSPQIYASGACAGNVDKDIPDNPFRGWPVENFEVCNLKTISAAYCSPVYEEELHAVHHGIDITSSYQLDGTYHSIDNQPVVSTAPFARVIAADSRVPDNTYGNYNGGYGNFVTLEALSQICYFDEISRSQVCKYTCEEWDNEDYNGDGKIDNYCGEPTGWKVIYAHLKYQSVGVTAGQVVKAGTVLGHVGNTGRSRGVHLHYQITSPDGRSVDPAITFGCEGYNRQEQLAREKASAEYLAQLQRERDAKEN